MEYYVALKKGEMSHAGNMDESHIELNEIVFTDKRNIICMDPVHLKCLK